MLSFLDTAYFDDVRQDKAVTPAPGFDMVVVDAAGAVVALLDTEIADGVATIDTVAVHPDHRRHGLARRLLDRARAEAETVCVGAHRLDQRVLAFDHGSARKRSGPDALRSSPDCRRPGPSPPSS